MKGRLYRILVITALTALTGLLVVQIYWFVKAYDIQEKQFDRTVNLALRSVTDKLLKSGNNLSERISPIRQTASNAYYVEVGSAIKYDLLDSLIKIEFKKADLFVPFELAVYEQRYDSLLFGSLYKHGVLSEGTLTCQGRDEIMTPMDFAITFTQKRSNIVGAMNIWIFTAITFLLILIVFGFMLMDLSKQKKLAEVKADFLNNMTHELQTPIANIAMASEVLRAPNLLLDQEKTARYANIIHDENQRLKFHMEQVLQIARMERGDMMMNKKEVDLNQIVNDVIRSFELRLQGRQGRIIKNLHASSTKVVGDPFHLANIFYNLLDNADKYSPENPEITITTENQEKGILVSIADKGIGIRKDVQKFIFDKFYRASTGNQHDVKGFGLGLTYVQQIVSAHNGVVTVSSEENKGSRFDVFFQSFQG
jgi:two-component system, OmpR family, phosphate regulon sensor histidine kinase PhoR